MPFDRQIDEEEYAEEEERKDPRIAGKKRRFSDFDCPDCDANNPYEDGFGDGDEIRCHYCGQEYRVQVSDEGRLRLRAT